MYHVEARETYRGFPIVCILYSGGYRCGYVGLSPSDKYYMRLYSTIPVECHGGLTYSDYELHGQNDLDIWWIGFDCAHAYDGFDVEAVRRAFGKDPLLYRPEGWRVIRTTEYVIGECRHIVDQIFEEESE